MNPEHLVGGSCLNNSAQFVHFVSFFPQSAFLKTGNFYVVMNGLGSPKGLRPKLRSLVSPTSFLSVAKLPSPLRLLCFSHSPSLHLWWRQQPSNCLSTLPSEPASQTTGTVTSLPFAETTQGFAVSMECSSTNFVWTPSISLPFCNWRSL